MNVDIRKKLGDGMKVEVWGGPPRALVEVLEGKQSIGQFRLDKLGSGEADFFDAEPDRVVIVAE